MDDHPKWYQNYANLHVVIFFLCVAVFYFWSESFTAQSRNHQLFAHLSEIDGDIEELEYAVQSFDDTNWREVVPDVRFRVQQVRTRINDFRYQLEMEEMKRELERSNDRPESP